MGVVEAFPDAEKFHSVAVTQPAEDEIVRGVGIFEPCDVCKTDVVRRVFGDDADHGALDFDGGGCGFFHAWGSLDLKSVLESFTGAM